MSRPFSYSCQAAYDGQAMRFRRGEDVMTSSRLHQLVLDVLGVPVALFAVPIVVICNVFIARAYLSNRVATGNVSKTSGSSTANAVLQARAMYHDFGFGPDHLAPVLVSRRNAFPTSFSHRCFLISHTTVVWYFRLFKRDLFALIYRFARSRGNLPPTDMATSLQVRTCWLDDVVNSFIHEGQSEEVPIQVVILGAGYDTRCFRLADGSVSSSASSSRRRDINRRRVTWFEADAKGTQEAKMAALEEAELDTSHVTFVPVDFTIRAGWLDALVEAGLDLSVKSLFVWEGVTMYLPREAVELTLRTVGENFPSGSKIAFTYITSEYAFDSRSQALLRRFGEPWLFALPSPGLLPPEQADDHVVELVERQGLTLVEHFWDIDEAKRRYLPAYPTGGLVGFAWRETYAGQCLASV